MNLVKYFIYTVDARLQFGLYASLLLKIFA